jgi:hypothetical protein
LAEAYEYPIGELQKYLSNEQMEFTTEIKGVDVFIDFMTRNGWIESAMDEAEVLWRSNGQ